MTADELGVPVELRDGSRVRIRQGHQSGRELLVRGFEHLGPESRYWRFLAPMHALGDRTVRYMTELDHHDHEAMIAVDVRGRPWAMPSTCATAGDRTRPRSPSPWSTNGKDGGSACCCSR
jgi:hypothetical protein